MEQATRDPNVITEWRKVDSYLHAFHSISENVINGENCRILHCILLLEKLPLSNMNVQVSQIVMELLGEFHVPSCLDGFCKKIIFFSLKSWSDLNVFSELLHY